MGRTCKAHGIEEKLVCGFFRNALKGRDRLRVLALEGRVILNG